MICICDFDNYVVFSEKCYPFNIDNLVDYFTTVTI